LEFISPTKQSTKQTKANLYICIDRRTGELPYFYINERKEIVSHSVFVYEGLR